MNQHPLLAFRYVVISKSQAFIYLPNRRQSQPACKSCVLFVILGSFIWLPALNRGTTKLPGAKVRTMSTRPSLRRRSCCHHRGQLLSDSTRISPQAQANHTKTSPLFCCSSPFWELTLVFTGQTGSVPCTHCQEEKVLQTSLQKPAQSQGAKVQMRPKSRGLVALAKPSSAMSCWYLFKWRLGGGACFEQIKRCKRMRQQNIIPRSFPPSCWVIPPAGGGGMRWVQTCRWCSHRLLKPLNLHMHPPWRLTGTHLPSAMQSQWQPLCCCPPGVGGSPGSPSSQESFGDFTECRRLPT